MANKVTFDYSKTAEYISEGEITAMKLYCGGGEEVSSEP